MSWLIAPENDYSSLDPRAGDHFRVTVVIPVFNRVALLARTVAGLVPQSHPRDRLTVVVADDGSTEDVNAAVDPFADLIELTVVRRDHDGYGAGQARNLGANMTDAEILIFIDADCLPHPDLVSRHVAWHAAADNLVVIGARQGIDTSLVDTQDLVRGEASLEALAGGVSGQTDHRRVLHRRTSGQRHGDEAFRSLVSSNFSIRRDRFLESGGFSDDFHRWGGEDVELGWRLFQEGLFIVPEDEAISYHQLQEDAWDEGGRESSRDLNQGIVASRIPHRFYRPPAENRIHEVPKVSFVIHPVIDTLVDDIEHQLIGQRLVDWEAIIPLDGERRDLFVERTRGDHRFRTVSADDPVGALRSTRGQFVVLLNGAAALDPSVLDVCIARLERSPRVGRVSVGYQIYDGSAPRQFRTANLAAQIDQGWGEEVPVFSIVRRRDWAKALRVADDLGAAWRVVDELTRPHHLADPLVALPSESPSLPTALPVARSDRTVLASRLERADSQGEMARAIGSFLKTRLKRRTTTPAPRAPTPLAGRPTARYIGWTGHENLGDEAMLLAARQLLGWADINTKGPGRLLLLGGGTLINRSNYLHWLAEQDSPRIERAVFGTGVANPDFWGLNENPSEWVRFLESCCFVGVRGPISVEILRSWGFRGTIEVTGDPALALHADPSTGREDGHVVVAPAWTGGDLWGGEDDPVYAAMAGAVKHWLSSGKRVTLLTCHPFDDRPALEIMRGAGAPDLDYLAGYRSIEGTLRTLASAELVIAERLHACVLAAAVGTPFVGIEYQPKVRDFAASVEWGQFVVRSDQVTTPRLIDLAERARTADLAPLSRAVSEYRSRLKEASRLIEEATR